MQKRRQAAIYVRISQDREGAGLGVKRQREDCEALAKRLGWHVVGVYRDNDTSAYTGKPRPNYARMLDDLRSGKADAVLAWHTDRLHRSPRELETYVDVCESHNVTTQTVKAGELDLSTPSGRAMARTLGAWARFESEHKSDRITRAHQQNAEDGKWRGGTRPFGFQKDGITHNVAEANEIRRLTNAVLAGESLGSLIRDLNERGIKTTTGKEWSYATLRQVLLRPRNVGQSVYKGEVVADGKWQAIVDKDEWRSVKRLLSDPSRRRSFSNRAKHLMAGLARCGECGRPMKSAVVNDRDGSPRLIYRCCVYRTASYVDMFVHFAVLIILRKDSARKLFVTDSSEENAARQLHVDALRKELDEQTEAYNARDITLGQLRNISRRLQVEIADIENSMVDNDRKHVLGDLVGKSDVIDRWFALPLDRKRAVIDTLMILTVPKLGRSASRRAGRFTFTLELRSDVANVLEASGDTAQSLKETLRTIAASPDPDSEQMSALRRLLAA